MIKKEIQTMINQIKSFFSDATIEKKLAIVDANSKKGEVLNEISYKEACSGVFQIYKLRFLSIWILSVLFSAVIAIGLQGYIIALTYSFSPIILFWIIEVHLRGRQYYLMAICIRHGNVTDDRIDLWSKYYDLKRYELNNKNKTMKANFDWFYIYILGVNVVLLILYVVASNLNFI